MLEIIKKLCKETGITIYQLEDNLGLGRNTIYQWNKRTPGIDKLKLVADYFNVSTDFLLERTSIPNYELTKEFASSISELLKINDTEAFDLINKLTKLDKKSLSAISSIVDRIIELEKRQPIN